MHNNQHSDIEFLSTTEGFLEILQLSLDCFTALHLSGVCLRHHASMPSEISMEFDPYSFRGICGMSELKPSQNAMD